MTRAAVIVLPGFHQRPVPTIGLGRLYRDLEHGCCRDRREVWLGMRTWHADHAATAQWIADADAEVIVAVAYSYGAGWALTKLARALQALGHNIDQAYLIDPVPRYRLWPLKAISMTRWGSYHLPPNVLRTDYWRQVNDAPYGRAVVHPDGLPVTCRGLYGSHSLLLRHRATSERGAPQHVDSGVGHTNIDDRADIRAAILREVAEIVAPADLEADG